MFHIIKKRWFKTISFLCKIENERIVGDGVLDVPTLHTKLILTAS